MACISLVSLVRGVQGVERHGYRRQRLQELLPIGFLPLSPAYLRARREREVEFSQYGHVIRGIEPITAVLAPNQPVRHLRGGPCQVDGRALGPTCHHLLIRRGARRVRRFVPVPVAPARPHRVVEIKVSNHDMVTGGRKRLLEWA
ncbi:hypothetical protein GB937_010661 [Aspergillus fischeri]|nr:hypothetical protein GB937_010661 [Aspergillus fischeri]